MLRKRESNECVAELLFRNLRIASRCNDQVLLSVASQLVRHRRGVSAGRELRLPKLFASFDVEAADVGIGCASNEHNAAGGNDGTAETDGAGRNLLRMRAAKIL